MRLDLSHLTTTLPRRSHLQTKNQSSCVVDDALHLLFFSSFSSHEAGMPPGPSYYCSWPAKAYCVARQQSRAEMIGRQTAGSMQSSSMFKTFLEKKKKEVCGAERMEIARRATRCNDTYFIILRAAGLRLMAPFFLHEAQR